MGVVEFNPLLRDTCNLFKKNGRSQIMSHMMTSYDSCHVQLDGHLLCAERGDRGSLERSPRSPRYRTGLCGIRLWRSLQRQTDTRSSRHSHQRRLSGSSVG